MGSGEDSRLGSRGQQKIMAESWFWILRGAWCVTIFSPPRCGRLRVARFFGCLRNTRLDEKKRKMP